MSSPEKRAAKSKERDNRKRAFRRAAHLRRIAEDRRSQYPMFEFSRNGAPEKYFRLVEHFYRYEFDFEKLPVDDKKALKNIRKYGWGNLESILRESEPGLSRESFVYRCIEILTALGDAAFTSRIKEELIRHVPYRGFIVMPSSNDILVDFRTLREKPAKGGIIYFESSEPKVVYDGTELKVGFSRHSIERIRTRLANDWTSFTGAGYVFRFLDGTCLYETTVLPDGEVALAIFFPCFPRCLHLELAEDLAGPKDDTEDWYLRLAYGPVVQCGDYLKVITILYPGFRGTPEFDALEKEVGDTVTKKRLLRVARNVSCFEVAKNAEARELLHWFHKNAAPQVVRKKKEGLTPVFESGFQQLG